MSYEGWIIAHDSANPVKHQLAALSNICEGLVQLLPFRNIGLHLALGASSNQSSEYKLCSLSVRLQACKEAEIQVICKDSVEQIPTKYLAQIHGQV